MEPTLPDMATPEPPPNLPSLSIRRILHCHPRERLQVHPFLWTSRHLHLLRCDFIEALPGPLSPPPSPSTSPAQRQPLSDKSLNSAGNPPQYQSIKANDENVVPSSHRLPSPPQQQTRPPASKHEKWARTLARSHLLTMKESSLTKLLSTPLFNARLTSDHTTLSFESKRIRLPCLTLAASTSSTTQGCIAYLDASSLRAARSRFLKQSCGHWNRITRSIYTARLAALTPAQEAHDPYIAAIIIAAAQQQQQRLACRGMASIQVHVILSDAHDTSQLLLYTANVPPSFLDKLTHTRRRPLPSATCQVYTRAILYEPFESFQQRFHEALLTPQGSGADRDGADTERDGHTIRKRGRMDQDEDKVDEEDGGAPRKRARVRRK